MSAVLNLVLVPFTFGAAVFLAPVPVAITVIVFLRSDAHDRHSPAFLLGALLSVILLFLFLISVALLTLDNS